MWERTALLGRSEPQAAARRGPEQINDVDVIRDNYEVRILNSFGKEKVTRDDAGAVYGFAASLVNAR